MALTAKMVASEILVCGVKAAARAVPIIGETAVSVVEGLQKRHQELSNAAQMAELDVKLSRVERGMRDTVEKEIRTILTNLGRPAVPGPELTREMIELRQIYEQGWIPSLFEGILRNSTHWEELRRNPKQYGRILSDQDPVNPENGLHLLLDKDNTRILEMPASSLAFLLGNQSKGIPTADVRVSQDIWAFPSLETTRHEATPVKLLNPISDKTDLSNPAAASYEIVIQAQDRGTVVCTVHLDGKVLANERQLTITNSNLYLRGLTTLGTHEIDIGSHQKGNFRFTQYPGIQRFRIPFIIAGHYRIIFTCEWLPAMLVGYDDSFVKIRENPVIEFSELLPNNR